MSISDLFYNLKKGGSLKNLIPISLIETNDDIKKYKEQGYNIILTNKEFKTKFPNIDSNKIFYEKDFLGSFIYYDENKIIYKMLIAWDNNDDDKNEKEMLYTIKAMEEWFDNKQWHSLISNGEGVLRFELLAKAIKKNLIEEDKIYELFMDIYRGADFGAEYISKEILEKIINYKTQESIEKTKKKLLSFPQSITIYRGEGDKSTPYNKAYSWSTDINIANFFAIRHAKKVQGL